MPGRATRLAPRLPIHSPQQSRATRGRASAPAAEHAPSSGSGNINATVNLPAGGSVTYTVTANISASATGSLVEYRYGHRASGRDRSDARQQQCDGYGHVECECGSLDHQDRRRHDGNAGRFGHLHDHREQRGTKQRDGRHGCRYIPRSDHERHVDMRRRGRRNMRSERLRQHQRTRSICRPARASLTP